MIPAFTLSLVACASVDATSFAGLCSTGIVARDEVADAIRAAGEDVTALLELARSYERASKRPAATRVYERVVTLDVDNERARKALRHQKYDGRWFESYVDLARYKREEAALMKKKGFGRWKSEWVPVSDLPFLRMGWRRDAQRNWAHPADIEHGKRIEEWKASGYQFRADDNSWIAPSEFERWAALEWKCGDEWLDLEGANRFHSSIDTLWEIAGEHFLVLTSCPWERGNSARWHADRTHAELLRLFGTAPATPPTVVVLNGLSQYNGAAAELLLDSEGLSSLHGAYFADSALDESVEPSRFLGAGVCYWAGGDSGMANWGPFWVRWAAAQSFVEALDPSWETVSELVSKGLSNPQTYSKAYWSEKRIPRWLRFGAASYVERYLANPQAAEGADPWDLRSFAMDELRKNGGLRELPKVFAFELTLQDIPGSRQLYSEAGLLVSFLLDGSSEDAELQSELDVFRNALVSGSREVVRAAGTSLENALAARTKAIRKYAKL